ncbi:hypothetical protein FALBO_14423 [Fusarium albosuccineum]|uniref:Uncharacterized protein n=2 Tax=Fusarium decemcellulare species complex TaxID=1329916 RepID=A0A8H4KWL5_9HYPO|nr:hypothetical protein FALBO_14423 [Fusarium albosuccineum]KAJ3526312.1 hypothetical protein NM208_g11249 [Fusarium decemcellulare]
MSITAAINDFFSSIYELLSSVFSTLYAVIHSIFSAILGFVSGLFNLIGDVVSGLVDVAGGVGKFVAGNAAILAVGAIGAFAYVRYTAQGQRLAANSKKTQ